MLSINGIPACANKKLLTDIGKNIILIIIVTDSITLV